MGENIILEKSYKFALRIVKLYKYLTEVRKEFVISKRLLSNSGCNSYATANSLMKKSSIR